jgi:formylglycine-generating enzyme required for sulfatase activity
MKKINLNQAIRLSQTIMIVNKKSSFMISNFIKKLFFILFLLTTTGNVGYANNVVVSNVALTGQNTTLHYTLVQFDISQDNSWRTSVGPSNWDAAWVFVKYRKKTQTTWNHATLNWVDGTGSGDGHTEPANSDINSSNDNGAGGSYGVFIHRDADMVQGSVNYTAVQLRWNYGVDGLIDADSVEVCVFAIEMVYVPQASFYVGSGGTESSAFYTYPTTTNAYQITSEGAITVGTAAGNLYYPNTSGLSGDQTGPIPAAFPKGYNAFYCMKYEITQAQYVAFLNKLDNTQATARAYTAGGNRNGITGSPGNYTTTNPYVACNFLSWADLAAYLDWAALRPMTELEYEKAARGTLAPVANEYAWGSSSITGATGISNAGLTNETASNAGANCAYNNAAGVQGPMRVGNFGQGVNTRTGVGASYYGIMDLSGNLSEHPVTVGKAEGRAFTGVNGNGVLTSSGDADASNWPNTTATGAGFRGGGWNSSSADYLRVSDRNYAAYTDNNRNKNYGGRGVRTAP